MPPASPFPICRPPILREVDQSCTRLIDAVRLAGYDVEIDSGIRTERPTQVSRRPEYTPVLETGLI